MDKTSVDLAAIYKAELDAACENLGAERSDLELLLAPIRAISVSHRQVPSLLKQAYTRLQELRETLAEPEGLISAEPEIAEHIEQAGRTLQAGETACLAGAEKALETASQHCFDLDNKPDLAAAILAARGLIAAVQQNYQRAGKFYTLAATTPKLEMARHWHYQIKRALILEDLGREFNDVSSLEQAVDLYENTLLGLAPKTERPDDWATTQNHLGTALAILGQRHRGTQLLERSIAAFESALSQRPRDKVPLDWAATQNNLGNAYGVLAQRRGDTEMLVKSVAAFESALEERTQEQMPQDWAATQNNFGAALHALGVRQEGTKLLSKSVTAYNNVLKVWTRQRVPLDWATTLNNLGSVLRVLGERQSGNRSLEKSVAAYNNALTERTRERVPQDWAMTQNNLGAALQVLGDRVEDSQTLTDAVTAYENALKEQTRETTPIGWAMTKANLSVARRTLAEGTRDIDIARMALSDFQAAVDVFRKASHAQYVSLGEEQVTKAKILVEELAAGA